jgi:hypothetical protein
MPAANDDLDPNQQTQAMRLALTQTALHALAKEITNQARNLAAQLALMREQPPASAVMTQFADGLDKASEMTIQRMLEKGSHPGQTAPPKT